MTMTAPNTLVLWDLAVCSTASFRRILHHRLNGLFRQNCSSGKKENATTVESVSNIIIEMNLMIICIIYRPH